MCIPHNTPKKKKIAYCDTLRNPILTKPAKKKKIVGYFKSFENDKKN